MKFRIIITLIITFFAAQAYGQSAYLFGFKGGMNVSTLGKQGSGYTAKLGYNFGFSSSWRYFQELGAQMELLVSQQGARDESYSDIKLNLTYLNAPIFAKIYFTEDAAIESGLQFGYLLKATQVDAGAKIPRKDDFKNFDFSGILGLSYSKSYGSIGIRYVLGINNVNNASRSAEVKFRNNVLQLYISKTLIDSR